MKLPGRDSHNLGYNFRVLALTIACFDLSKEASEKLYESKSFYDKIMETYRASKRTGISDSLSKRLRRRKKLRKLRKQMQKHEERQLMREKQEKEQEKSKKKHKHNKHSEHNLELC